MEPLHIFLCGIGLLGLFVWYFATELPKKRRLIGTVLTVLLAVFCVYSWKTQGINRGIDLQGGSSFTVEIQPNPDAEGKPLPISPTALDEVMGIMERRLNADQTKDLVQTKQGLDRVIIQMPGIDEDEIAAVRKQIEQVAKLEFRIVHPQSESKLFEIRNGGPVAPGWVEMNFRDSEKGTMLVRNRPDLEGKYVKEAHTYLSPRGWSIILGFNSEGARRFGKLTEANVNNRLAAIIDGEIVSAPNLNEAIYGGSAEISGDFKEAEARELANALSNPLSNPLKIIRETSTSAIHGEATIKQGVFAGIAGLAATLIFMILYYRVAGIVALLGLALNILLLFGTMAMFGLTLTMPGIAGILLTIGIAIDANVLIYERLREEMKSGKSLWAAIQAAYDKAFSAIFDANVTTLITALILFIVASGTIKGFALTLTIGIFASLFAALLVTRVCYGWLVPEDGGGRITTFKFLSILRDKLYNVLSHRRAAMYVSIALLSLAIIVVAVKRDKAFGIDFLGGDEITYSLGDTEVDPDEVRDAITGLQVEITNNNETTMEDVGEFSVQPQTSLSGERYLVVRSQSDRAPAIVEEVKKDLPNKAMSAQIEAVGPSIGAEMARSSVLALVLGLAGIMLYVTLRFEFAFAIGALVALVHDIIITFGMVALTGREVSLMLVGAFLTIAGYSINDTIVVFDRIRELLKTQKGDVEKIMNQAISSTLNRTLLTSMTTLVMVVTLYIFGGPVLKDFAFTIIIGVLIGTYSSIFVASPIVLWWTKRNNKNLRRQVLETEAEREAMRRVQEGGPEVPIAPAE